MKLSFLLLITSFLQVSYAANGQTITLSEKNATMAQVFKKIGVQSGYDFVYGNRLLNNAKPVTIRVKDADITAVLNQVFAGQDLSYTIKNKTVVVSVKEKSVIGEVMDFFNAIDVKGKVVDDKGLPMQGAIDLKWLSQ